MRFGLIGAIAALCAACAPLPPTGGAAQAAPRALLFRSHATACYHAPALVSAGSGVLVAAVEQRFGYNKVNAARFRRGDVDAMPTGQTVKACSDSGFMNLVARRSTDGGKSWSATRVLVGYDQFLEAGWRIAAVGNPVLVARDANVILLFTLSRSRGPRNTPACLNPARDDRSECRGETTEQSFWTITSPDGGASWGSPRRVDVPLDARLVNRSGPGNGIVLRSGRIVVPTFNFLLLSDDGGRTWRRGASTKGNRLDGGEASVVQLPDGRVWMSARASTRSYRALAGSPPFRVSAYSADNGASYARIEADTRLPMPPVGAGLLSWQGRIYKSFPYSTAPSDGSMLAGERRRLTIAASEDGGKSWRPCMIDASAASYSDMAGIDAGTIGILYETGADDSRFVPGAWKEGLLFRRISVAQLGDRCPAP